MPCHHDDCLLRSGAWSDLDEDISSPASDNDSPQFELVQLVLVPPPPPRTTTPSSNGSGSGPLSARAKQGLIKLLKMCGFEGVASEEEGEEVPDAAAHLTTFLPEAAEVCAEAAVQPRPGSPGPGLSVTMKV